MGSGGHRGGTVAMVRRSLHNKVVAVDTSTPDQVWLRLAVLPNLLIGFVYIPPTDSPYFSPEQLSAIQERVRSAEEGTRFLILGDMNARFGEWATCQQLQTSLTLISTHTRVYPIK